MLIITIAPIIFTLGGNMKGSIVMDFDSLKNQISGMKGTLDERAYRFYLGQLAVSIGRGGLALISNLSGSSVNTVKRGMNEVKEKQSASSATQSDREEPRVRKIGGGRKSAATIFSNLDASIGNSTPL